MEQSRYATASSEMLSEMCYQQVFNIRLFLVICLLDYPDFYLFIATWLLGEFNAFQQGGLLTRRWIVLQVEVLDGCHAKWVRQRGSE